MQCECECEGLDKGRSKRVEMSVVSIRRKERMQISPSAHIRDIED